MARCHDCLTEDVAVKVIDQCGIEHWFCAEDWEANRQLHAAIMKRLAAGAEAMSAASRAKRQETPWA